MAITPGTPSHGTSEDDGRFNDWGAFCWESAAIVACFAATLGACRSPSLEERNAARESAGTQPHVKGKTEFPSKSEVPKPRVDITVNGHQVSVTLDTGASFTVLQSSTAHRLALRCNGPSGSVPTPSGSLKLTPCDPATLKLGNYASAVEVRVGDLGASEPQVEGVLGLDFLSHYVVELDLTGGLKLQESSGFQRTDPGIPMQLDPSGNFVIQASFDTVTRTNIQGPFSLDTGSDFAVSVLVNEADMNGVPRQALNTHSVGLANSTHQYIVPAFHLAGRTHLNVQLVQLPSHYTFGLIGREILDQYKLTFDFPRRTVWLDPKAK